MSIEYSAIAPSGSRGAPCDNSYYSATICVNWKFDNENVYARISSLFGYFNRRRNAGAATSARCFKIHRENISSAHIPRLPVSMLELYLRSSDSLESREARLEIHSNGVVTRGYRCNSNSWHAVSRRTKIDAERAAASRDRSSRAREILFRSVSSRRRCSCLLVNVIGSYVQLELCNCRD